MESQIIETPTPSPESVAEVVIQDSSADPSSELRESMPADASALPVHNPWSEERPLMAADEDDGTDSEDSHDTVELQAHRRTDSDQPGFVVLHSQ